MDTLTPAEIRQMLEQAGIDITAPVWSPQCVLVGGLVYRPHPARGYLIVDGQVAYSAAWL